MTTQTYHDLILQGISGLPTEVLSEITNYIYFMRKRFFEPEQFQDEMQTLLLHEGLSLLDEAELNHLEEEFENYEQRFPLQ